LLAWETDSPILCLFYHLQITFWRKGGQNEFFKKVGCSSFDFGWLQSCFLAGTLIKYPDGTSKPIEQVQVGDEVLSYDILNKKYARAEVLELYSRVRDGYNILSFSDGTKLEVTDEHPIYTKRGWASVNPDATEKNTHLEMVALAQGDLVFKDGNSWITISKIESIKKEVKIYNLRVSDYNTFFAGDVLVHNKLKFINE